LQPADLSPAYIACLRKLINPKFLAYFFLKYRTAKSISKEDSPYIFMKKKAAIRELKIPPM
jgi:hypothetical protein